jgi:hypothetical protein
MIRRTLKLLSGCLHTFGLPPYPKEVGVAVEKASLNNFPISTDGIPYFHIDGKKYTARKVGPVSLRRFAARTDVKSSQPVDNPLSPS